MDSVNAQLAASRKAYEEKQFEAGKCVGAEWARESAEWEQLNRLRREFVSCESSTTTFVGLMGDSLSPAKFLAEAIDGEGGDWLWFWWGVIPPDDTTPLEDVEWLCGFADGALEVFDETPGGP